MVLKAGINPKEKPPYLPKSSTLFGLIYARQQGLQTLASTDKNINFTRLKILKNGACGTGYA
jgi:hypothetical protein